MSGETILRIVKTILRIVMLETGYAGSSSKSQCNFFLPTNFTNLHECPCLGY